MVDSFVNQVIPFEFFVMPYYYYYQIDYFQSYFEQNSDVFGQNWLVNQAIRVDLSIKERAWWFRDKIFN